MMGNNLQALNTARSISRQLTSNGQHLSKTSDRQNAVNLPRKRANSSESSGSDHGVTRYTQLPLAAHGSGYLKESNNGLPAVNESSRKHLNLAKVADTTNSDWNDNSFVYYNPGKSNTGTQEISSKNSAPEAAKDKRTNSDNSTRSVDNKKQPVVVVDLTLDDSDDDDDNGSGVSSAVGGTGSTGGTISVSGRTDQVVVKGASSGVGVSGNGRGVGRSGDSSEVVVSGVGGSEFVDSVSSGVGLTFGSGKRVGVSSDGSRMVSVSSGSGVGLTVGSGNRVGVSSDGGRGVGVSSDGGRGVGVSSDGGRGVGVSSGSRVGLTVASGNRVGVGSDGGRGVGVSSGSRVGLTDASGNRVGVSSSGSGVGLTVASGNRVGVSSSGRGVSVSSGSGVGLTFGSGNKVGVKSDGGRGVSVSSGSGVGLTFGSGNRVGVKSDGGRGVSVSSGSGVGLTFGSGNRVGVKSDGGRGASVSGGNTVGCGADNTTLPKILAAYSLNAGDPSFPSAEISNLLSQRAKENVVKQNGRVVNGSTAILAKEPNPVMVAEYPLKNGFISQSKFDVISSSNQSEPIAHNRNDVTNVSHNIVRHDNNMDSIRRDQGGANTPTDSGDQVIITKVVTSAEKSHGRKHHPRKAPVEVRKLFFEEKSREKEIPSATSEREVVKRSRKINSNSHGMNKSVERHEKRTLEETIASLNGTVHDTPWSFTMKPDNCYRENKIRNLKDQLAKQQEAVEKLRTKEKTVSSRVNDCNRVLVVQIPDLKTKLGIQSEKKQSFRVFDQIDSLENLDGQANKRKRKTLPRKVSREADCDSVDNSDEPYLPQKRTRVRIEKDKIRQRLPRRPRGRSNSPVIRKVDQLVPVVSKDLWHREMEKVEAELASSNRAMDKTSFLLFLGLKKVEAL